MEVESPIVLCPHQVDFFKYFISQYHDHFKKGELNEANHCAVAVLLELENMIHWSCDE